MGPVTPEGCEHWHGLLAMEVIGQLEAAGQLALSAHLDGCPDCRDQRAGLAGLGGVLAAADPDHLGGHEVPFALQSAVFSRLEADARHDRRIHRRRYVLGGAAAAVVVALAVTLGLSGSAHPPAPGRTVELSALSGPSGVTASARLTSEPWGTAVHLKETGQPGGQVLTVSMRSTGGSWWAAGTYRTVTGRTVQVDLACGVPASKISSIWVRNKAGQTVLRGYAS